MRCCGIARPGPPGPGGSDKTAFEANGIEFPAAEGDGPVAERASSPGRVSQVARAPWNPVRICPDRRVSLSISV